MQGQSKKTESGKQPASRHPQHADTPCQRRSKPKKAQTKQRLPPKLSRLHKPADLLLPEAFSRFEAFVVEAFPKGSRSTAFKNLLKVPLFDYPREGVLAARSASRGSQPGIASVRRAIIERAEVR